MISSYHEWRKRALFASRAAALVLLCGLGGCSFAMPSFVDDQPAASIATPAAPSNDASPGRDKVDVAVAQSANR
jgi:hypothetical protein